MFSNEECIKRSRDMKPVASLATITTISSDDSISVKISLQKYESYKVNALNIYDSDKETIIFSYMSQS